MPFTAAQLASRDPALAALLGANPNSSFGDDYSTGPAYPYADHRDAISDFGDDWDYGAEFGDDFGAQFAADAAPAALATTPKPTPQAMMQVWQQYHAMKQHTQRRNQILEPNKGSHIKIERYGFAANQTLTLGVAAAITASNNPDCTIRPQRVEMNAPSYGFVTVSEIKLANVSVSVGGIQDAFSYNANAVGASLDCPTLSPANKATVLGAYTGFVPTGFVGGASYLFAASFKGPATIVA